MRWTKIQVNKPRPGYKLVKSIFGKYEEIPIDWDFIRLDEVGEIIGGGTPDSTNKEYWNGNVLWAVPGEITKLTSNLISNTERKISEKGLNVSSAKLLPIGSILITSRATIGECAINEKPMATNQGFQNLICNKQNDNLFWFNAIKFHKNRFLRLASGTTFLEISKNDIKKVSIPAPKLKQEQQKIASILSNIDSLIHKTQKEIAQTEQLKNELMQELFSKGLGHTKFNEYKLTKHGIVSLGKIPEKWNVKTIHKLKEENQIIEFQDGNHGELHPKSTDFTNEGKPFLTASQIDDNGTILLSKCKRLPENFCSKLRIGFSKAKDVLFTHNATVGRVAVIPENFPDCIVGTSVTYYRLNEEKINRFYFGYVLKSNFIKKQYNTEMDQTTRQQFSILKQAQLKIPLPNLDEQQKIASILSNIDSLIHKTQKEIAQTEQLKIGLLQKLLTGQVRVKI